MIYNLQEYAKAFPVKGKEVSVKTIRRMISTNRLPANHEPIKITSVQYVIEVNRSKSEIADDIEKAAVEFWKSIQFDKKFRFTEKEIKVAYKICEKYKVNKKVFFNVLCIKE